MCLMTNIQPCLTRNKKVCFGSVQVREHQVILGDNPSCSEGPPLTLAWDHDTSISLTLEEWEGGRCLERRTKDEIRVPATVRTEWILDAGYSPLQVHEAIRTAQKEKQRRRSSLGRSSLQDRADVVAESMKRKFERAVGKRTKSENLHKMLMLSR